MKETTELIGSSHKTHIDQQNENSHIDDAKNTNSKANKKKIKVPVSSVKEQKSSGKSKIMDPVIFVKKTKLENIIPNVEKRLKIYETIDRSHRIITYVYQFINLYFIYLYDNDLPMPIIDNTLIRIIIRVIIKKNREARKSKEEDYMLLHYNIKHFYKKHFKEQMVDAAGLFSDNLSNIINYQINDIVKNIENNIKEHFIEHVNRLVNCYFDKKQILDNVNNQNISNKEKDNIEKNFLDKLKKIKKELLTVPIKKWNKYEIDSDSESENCCFWMTDIDENSYVSRANNKIIPDDYFYDEDDSDTELNYSSWKEDNERYSDIEKNIKSWIIKQKDELYTKKLYAKNSIYYDVCVHPQDYIKQMIYLNKELQKIDNINKVQFQENYKKISLFRALPLRTSLIPTYVTIDTNCLIDILEVEDPMKYRSNIVENSEVLWGIICNLNIKEFRRNGYKFHNMIMTDGVACSILFHKVDKNGNPIHARSGQSNHDDEYIEKSIITNDMKDKTVVVIDPNYGDIIHCVAEMPIEAQEITFKNRSGETKTRNIKENTITKFRYTQTQRRQEQGLDRYTKIRNIKNEETIINGKTVKQHEQELCGYNSKLYDFEQFKAYIKKKNEINGLLRAHYSAELFRKFKFNVYINTQKSEAKMINNFTEKFGGPEGCLLVIGDFDKKNNMKGKEPTINRKTRKIFRLRGYKPYKVNEYCTSKKCSRCENDVETFLRREMKNKKTGKKKIIKVWGLVRCKAKTCKLIFNRDTNACLNMLKIVKSVLKEKGRPVAYKRKKKLPVRRKSVR